MKYSCNKCEYVSEDKSNYNRHMKSNNHNTKSNNTTKNKNLVAGQCHDTLVSQSEHPTSKNIIEMSNL
jgi:hypothetical protein